jgi:hypothetical protein
LQHRRVAKTGEKVAKITKDRSQGKGQAQEAAAKPKAAAATAPKAKKPKAAADRGGRGDAAAEEPRAGEEARTRGAPAGAAASLTRVLAKHDRRLPEKLVSRLKTKLVQLKSKLSDDRWRRWSRRPTALTSRHSSDSGARLPCIGRRTVSREPGTQMTLRTFHYAGVRELNVKHGHPRLIEIVDARMVPSDPTMTIFLDDEHKHDLSKAKGIAANIETDTVENVAKSIGYEMLNNFTIEVDAEMCEDKMIDLNYIAKSIEKLKIPHGSVEVEQHHRGAGDDRPGQDKAHPGADHGPPPEWHKEHQRVVNR